MIVNKLVRRLLLMPFWSIFLCNASTDEVFTTPRPSGELKQAIAQYIKQTDAHFSQKIKRDADENASYKKELRYLFKNYGNFSAPALLSRVRSAHQAMVKTETNKETEIYQQYEQISSALLLICAQVFCNDVRNQLLNALHTTDQLIMYWRDEQQHQLHYFFHKSPIKWILGKSQAQEITDNLKRLGAKQRELYTILGALTGHIHALTERDMSYNDCYEWMDELFAIVKCVQNTSSYTGDGTKLDDLAAQLGLKMKVVSSLKYTILRSVASAKKPTHLVRHWIAYAAALAAAGYAAHYYAHNYSDVNKALNGYFIASGDSWQRFVVDPTKDICNTIFGKEDPLIKQEHVEFDKGITDFAKDIKELETKKDFNKKTCDDLRKYIEEDRKNVQEKMKELLDAWLSGKYIDQNKYDEIINAEAMGNIAPYQAFLFFDVKKNAHNWAWSAGDILDAVIVLLELHVYHYGSNIIHIVFELVINYGIPVVKEALIVLSKINREWATIYKKVNLILNVGILTPTILIGGAGGRGLYKTYQWATAKNYSPIRIALADINALLIESATQLNDQDYGKLVYLICKLRHKATYLKDPLAHEFLTDVTKLESKQYNPAIKRGIVENMFNKYAFLGRVVA